MTLVRNWSGYDWADPVPQLGNVVHNWRTEARIGWTLVRTVADIAVRIDISTPHFPPYPIAQMCAGVYQYVNFSGEAGNPSIGTYGADWVWFQQVPMQTGFGVGNPIQSDLQYDGYLHFDSKAKRKSLVDFPSMVLALGPPHGWQPGAPVQEYTWTWQAVIRQLWEHNI